MKRQAVVFDLDGTLLDTLDDLADSGNRVLSELGLPTHPVDAYKYFVGDGIGILIRRMLPEDRHDEQTIAEATRTYRREYGRRWNAKTKPYDGTKTLLDELTARGVKKAVLSNKPDEFTRRCVEELLGRWTFDVVLGHHDGIPRKPDPAGAREVVAKLKIPPAEIAYLGDTATDMQTAVAAGMFPVGALWGFRKEEELREGGAEVLIRHPTELLNIVGPRAGPQHGAEKQGGSLPADGRLHTAD